MLFRPEVLKHRQQRLEGEIIVSVDIGWHIISLTLAAIGMITITFLFATNFARKETAPGILVASPGVVKIFAAKPGTVHAIQIKEGDVVSVGQPLLSIDVDPIADGGQATATIQIIEINRQVAEIENQIGLAQRNDSEEQKRLGDRNHRLKAQIANLRASLGIQATSIDLQEQQVAAAVKLLKTGNIAKTEVQRRQTELQDLRLSEQNIRLQIDERQADLEEAQSALLRLPTSLEVELSRLRATAADLRQNLAAAESRSVYTVLAPIAGRIDLIQADQGRAISANAPIISVLPVNSELHAEIMVPTRAIGLVEPGQGVRLALEAFPYLRFGFVEGHVVSVSRTLLNPNEIQELPLQREPAYRIIVELDGQSIKADGREYLLRPGMLLTGDIILERNDLMTWLIRSATEVWERT